MPSELDNAIRQFRRLRAQHEASTARALQDAYAVARDSIRRDLNQLVTWIEEEQAAGREIPKWRLLQEARLQRLLRQAEVAFDQYARETGNAIIREQRAAVFDAQGDAQRLIEAGFGPPPPGVRLPFAALPNQAISQLVASLRPDAPVWRLLNEFAGNAAKTVEAELIAGMAKGINPQVIARRISTALGGQYDRAFLITRTETLRAYRSAQQEVYRANGHLLRGWRWHSALDRRTCVVCIGLHNRLFATDDPMRPHPACRCSVVPETKSWRDLGYDLPEPVRAIETGLDWFARQSVDVQRRILRYDNAYDAYAAGDVRLEDFIVLNKNGTWGDSYIRGSVDDARARAAARQQRAA